MFKWPFARTPSRTVFCNLYVYVLEPYLNVIPHERIKRCAKKRIKSERISFRVCLAILQMQRYTLYNFKFNNDISLATTNTDTR